MMRKKKHDLALKHIIRRCDAGFELVTCWGFVLKTCPTREEVVAYYEWHCPSDF